MFLTESPGCPGMYAPVVGASLALNDDGSLVLPLEKGETDPRAWLALQSWFDGGIGHVRDVVAKGPYPDPTPSAKPDETA